MPALVFRANLALIIMMCWGCRRLLSFHSLMQPQHQKQRHSWLGCTSKTWPAWQRSASTTKTRLMQRQQSSTAMLVREQNTLTSVGPAKLHLKLNMHADLLQPCLTPPNLHACQYEPRDMHSLMLLWWCCSAHVLAGYGHSHPGHCSNPGRSVRHSGVCVYVGVPVVRTLVPPGPVLVCSTICGTPRELQAGIMHDAPSSQLRGLQTGVTACSPPLLVDMQMLQLALHSSPLHVNAVNVVYGKYMLCAAKYVTCVHICACTLQ